MRKLITLMVIVQLAVMAGCNPYQKIMTQEPKSTRDSLNLASRCQSTFPAEILDTIYIPGVSVTDTLWMPVEIDFSDTVFAPGANIDSIKKVLLEKCKPKIITVKTTDTLRLPCDRFEIAKLELSAKVHKQQADSAIRVMNAAIVAGIKKDKYVWGFWLLLALLAAVSGTWAYMKFKKP